MDRVLQLSGPLAWSAGVASAEQSRQRTQRTGLGSLGTECKVAGSWA